MMSAVLSVEGAEAEDVAALALVAGLATAKALRRFGAEAVLKWPNDVLAGGRKLAGLLCRRNGDLVVVGIGVNVRQRMFAPEIADRAASLASLALASATPSVAEVRDAVLAELDGLYRRWREGGFAAVYPELRGFDFLRGRTVSVVQTDDGDGLVRGVSAGIAADGSLDVGGVMVYAGEAHVEEIE
jgi:BirA family biotin operon repressor/biotin-[acetyl-CoA-carboxylase] ligase